MKYLVVLEKGEPSAGERELLPLLTEDLNSPYGSMSSWKSRAGDSAAVLAAEGDREGAMK